MASGRRSSRAAQLGPRCCDPTTLGPTHTPPCALPTTQLSNVYPRWGDRTRRLGRHTLVAGGNPTTWSFPKQTPLLHHIAPHHTALHCQSATSHPFLPNMIPTTVPAVAPCPTTLPITHGPISRHLRKQCSQGRWDLPSRTGLPPSLVLHDRVHQKRRNPLAKSEFL